MKSQIRNTLIFILIAGALFFAYLQFFKTSPEEDNLVSSSENIFPGLEGNMVNSNEGGTPLFNNDLVSLLLGAESISLNSEIFQNESFKILRDSSILLVPPNNEGRINPFAPIGFDPAPTLGNQDVTANAGIDIDASSDITQDTISDRDLEDLDALLDF